MMTTVLEIIQGRTLNPQLCSPVPLLTDHDDCHKSFIKNNIFYNYVS